MKRVLCLFLTVMMMVSLCACGGKSGVSPEQMIADVVRTQVESETFTERQELAESFMGSAPKAPEVTSVIHYEIRDFEGEKMDCYLVNISADVAWWNDEEAQLGTMAGRYQLYISSDGKTVMDSISVDAMGFNGDFSTPEGRAIYLLWIYGSMMDGVYDGAFLNGTETVTEWPADKLAAINENL